MDASWLKTQFSLHPDKTKSGLADILGLEPPAISKIIAGNRQIKAHEYHLMRQYFDLPVDGQKAVKSDKSAYIIAPLTDGNSLRENEPDAKQDEWIMPATLFSERTSAPPEQIKIFKIRDNTMEPAFRQGEHVLVDLSDRMPSPPGRFIISDGFGYLIRQCEFLPGATPPQVRLSTAQNHTALQTSKLSDLDIIGRAIAKLQWL